VVLAALWLLVFSVASQFLVMAPVLPRIAAQLGIAPARLGVLVTGYGVAVGVVAVVMGPVSDRVGRRWMLLAGAVVMAAALALHAAAGTLEALLAVRVLAGAGGGVLTGATAAYVGDYFPYERRGWANGWVMSGMAAGQVLGVPMGAVLAQRWGFRTPFLAFALCMAAAAFLVWRVLPQPAVERSADEISPGDEVRHYARLLARPAVLAAAAVYFSANLASSLYELFLPTWLEGSRGASATQIALIYAGGGLATVIAGPWAGRLSDRVGRRGMAAGACLGGAVLMALTGWLVTRVWVAFALFFLLMALVAARSSPLTALLSELVPARERGSLMSLLMAVGQLGFGAGGGVAGAVFAARGYPTSALLAAGALLLAGVLVRRFLPEPAPPRPAAGTGGRGGSPVLSPGRAIH
jgi:predicted MFS family arabinose efflux permease